MRTIRPAGNLRTRVSERLAASRNRRHLERYLAESTPAARRELETILARRTSGDDSWAR